MKTLCNMCRSKLAEVRIPYAKLSLCPECFKDFFVRRIRNTVKEFRMFSEDDFAGVVISGGKESTALLHALRVGFPNLRIVALHR
ncbi:MAG: hypothetical protein ACUVQ0_04800 [Thermoproteota archaeon]